MSVVPSHLKFTQIHELVTKCRLVNQTAVDELSNRLRHGIYCVILGPRFSEKSFLLDDVADVLRTDSNVLCVRLDLAELRHCTGTRFIRRFGAALNEAAGTNVGLPRTERQLVHFLHDVPGVLKTHVILLLDHLELLPVNDIVVLLGALRGAFGEQRGRKARFPLTCAAATSFAVASLTFGPNSPFNDGYTLWVGDLDRDDSRKLFATIAGTLGVEADEQFFELLFAVTRGDRYLIALLCNCCAKIAAEGGLNRLSIDDIALAEEWFFKHAAGYPPLQETTRALEQPDILRLFMQVLSAERIEQKDLEIGADERADVLRLTGAVRLVNEGGRTYYETRNALVRRYMSEYYHPVRVARVSFMAGRFDEAVTYLESQPRLRQDRRLRTAFLEAVVSTINVASTVHDAVEHLAERIAYAFDLKSAAVYIVSPDLTHLECRSVFGQKSKRIKLAEQQSVVFREGQYRMRHETQRLTLVLTSRNDVRFGVIDVHGFKGDAQSEEFSDILAVARLIGWALGNVLQRERLILQFRKLDVTGRKFGSLDLEYVLQAIVDAGVEAVPGAQRGLLLLYDEREELLRVESFSKGYRPNIREGIRLAKGQGYAGRVFESGQPVIIPDPQNDSRVLLHDDEDIGKQKSVVCVPLFVWGRTIGVFILDNVIQVNAFRDEDMGLLSGLAAQAASALQTSMVFRELYQLSIKVNRGDISSRDIFLEAAQSIVHVTGAFAANMLLLPYGDDPDRAVRSKPLLSVAYKLSQAFEKNDRPARPDGLTFLTLRDRKLSICSRPDDGPCIGPLALAEDVRATIALPLSVQGQIRGVLFVHHRDEHDFSRDEQHVLSLFANLCAEALEEARHAEQLRVHGSIAWMGLDLSEMWHTFVQVIPPLRIYFEILKQEIGDKPTAKEPVKKMGDSIDALAGMEKALLPVHEDIEDVDVAELVRIQVRERCKAHEKIDPDFSDIGSTPVHVRCDRRRLGKVLKCLTENAVRAANRTVRPQIVVGLRCDTRNVDIIMTNNGPAIPAAVQDNLFKNPVRPSGNGRGVGLLIARSIVTGYGGDLECVSSIEDATTFRLSLPLARAQEAI